MKNIVTKRVELSEDEEEQPLSPQARIYLDPDFDIPIIGIIGFKSRVDVGVMIEGLKNTLFHHPRFSSKVVIEGGATKTVKWERTTVNPDDHIIVPKIDPNIQNPDKFLEDYVSNLSTVPMDFTKPMWEFHILNIETSYAESTGVFRISHAVGDGNSLISLILACTRKVSDPEALPSLPTQKKRTKKTSGTFLSWLLSVWTCLMMIWNSVVDFLEFYGTIMFLKDTKNPLVGEYGGVPSLRLKKRLLHRTVKLDDVKLVGKAMNAVV